MLETLAKRIALKLFNIAYKIQHILYSVIFYVTFCHSLILWFIQQTCPWRLCSLSIFCALYRKGGSPLNSLVKASPLPWAVPDCPPYKPSHCPFPEFLLPLVFTSSHRAKLCAEARDPGSFILESPVLAQCPIYQRYSTNVCWMNNPMCFLSALAAKRLRAKHSYQVQ